VVTQPVSDLILSSSTTGLLVEGELLTLHSHSDASIRINSAYFWKLISMQQQHP